MYRIHLNKRPGYLLTLLACRVGTLFEWGALFKVCVFNIFFGLQGGRLFEVRHLFE